MNDTQQQTGNIRRYRLEGFQLDEHPRSLMAVILFVVFAGYGFVDTFVTAQHGYASAPPFGLFAVAGGLIGAICFLWLHMGAVPRNESIGIAAILAVAVACASYPGFLRINTVIGADQYTLQTYRLGKDLTLHGVDTSLPSLVAPLDRAYWNDQDIGEQWTLEMRQGLLGVWVYRIGPLHDEIEEYTVRKAIVEGVMQ